MIILGLDPALRQFGWAALESDNRGNLVRCLDRGRIQSEVHDYPDHVARLGYLRSQVRELVRRFAPDGVGVESTVFGQGAHYKEGMYALFMFVLEGLKLEGVDVVLFAPKQAKVYARNLLEFPTNWKMKKKDMVEAAQRACPEDLSKAVRGKGPRRWDHNEADAFIHGLFALRFWSVFHGKLEPELLSAYELHTFLAARKTVRGEIRYSTKKNVKGYVDRVGDRVFRWSQGTDSRGPRSFGPEMESQQGYKLLLEQFKSLSE